MNKTISTMIIFASISALSGCTILPGGEKAYGKPGSALFDLTTSAKQKAEYIQAICKRYGYNKNNPNWAECIQKESKRLGYIPKF